ncbi:hypothetical protein HGO21_16215 [Acinetobacter sp. CUI P1]|nr:hypothetical protein [Acinetobacter sp. CUI P1]
MRLSIKNDSVVEVSPDGLISVASYCKELIQEGLEKDSMNHQYYAVCHVLKLLDIHIAGINFEKPRTIGDPECIVQWHMMRGTTIKVIDLDGSIIETANALSVPIHITRWKAGIHLVELNPSNNHTEIKIGKCDYCKSDNVIIHVVDDPTGVDPLHFCLDKQKCKDAIQ